MNIAWRPSLLAGSLCALAALLAGCSAGSGKSFGGKAGNQSSLAPAAVITVIGHVPAPDGTVYVRSGAEVVLSSKDSDGRDSAILGVAWTPINVAAQGVKMIERGGTAMSFRAPQPPDDTPLELRFGLEVTAGDGDTDSTEVRVLVSRVPDPNDFLLSDASTTNDAVNVVLVASSFTGASDFNALGRDAEFAIQVQKQVRYKRAINTGANPSVSPAVNDPLYCLSADPEFTCVKIGAPLLINGSWKQSAGVSGTAVQLIPPLSGTLPLPRNGQLGVPWQNPRFRLRPPSLNADEVNFAVLTNGILTNFNGTGVPPSDARRNNLLYTADIDTAEAEYVLTMSSADLGSTGRRANLLVFAADATTPAALTFLGEGRAATSADPGVVTITGTQALSAIKAAPGVVESRETAQAYYAAIDPLNQRANLDDWLNDNCMQRELAGVPGYYGSDIHATYLNDRDLGFGREMYFKTDCTTAQRAATGATIDTNAGERASIVFNYASLEGAIKRSGSFLAVAMEYRADASGGPKYTRFYTFAPDPRTRGWKRVTSANFDGRRERYTPGNCTVCHGGKPRASYTPAAPGGGDLGATFVPWDANALLFADTDPSVVDPRLKPGFTRAEQLPLIQALNMQGVRPIVVNRIAETQPIDEVLARWNATLDLLDKWYSDAAGYDYVPTAWQGGFSTATPTLASETLYSQVIAGNCRMCHLQRIADAGGIAATAPQFSSFADSFVSGINTNKTRQRVFEQHIMPASRLTADRFWLTQPGDTQSAAQVLAAHLGLSLPAAIPAVAAVASQPAEVDPGTSGAPVRLSGLQSRFASSFSWTLQRPVGSNAVLVGATTAEPAFLADVSGNYVVNLTVTDAVGQTSSLETPVTVVADLKPQATNFQVSANSGDFVTVVLPSNGVTLGDGDNTLSVTHNLPGTTLGYPSFCTSNGLNSGGNCRISFTAAGSGTINYQFVDADGDASSGTITVSVALPNQWSIATRNLSTTTCATGFGTNACGTALGINSLALAKTALSLTNLTDQQFLSAYTVAVNIAQPSQAGKTGGTAFVSASATAMTYTPPAYFVSAQVSGSPLVTDTFQFSITVRNAAPPNAVVSQSANGIVNMTVNARSTWSSVLAILNGNCTACHGADRNLAGEGRAWGSLTTDNTGVTTYNDLAGTRRTSCPAGEAGGTALCVDFTNPAGSMLLHKPKGELNHSGTTPGYNVGLSSGQFDTIETWIRDGAYRN